MGYQVICIFTVKFHQSAMCVSVYAYLSVCLPISLSTYLPIYIHHLFTPINTLAPATHDHYRLPFICIRLFSTVVVYMLKREFPLLSKHPDLTIPGSRCCEIASTSRDHSDQHSIRHQLKKTPSNGEQWTRDSERMEADCRFYLPTYLNVTRRKEL